jgi:integrase
VRASSLARSGSSPGRSNDHLSTKTALQDDRPPSKGGRDPGGLPPKEALPEEGHPPYILRHSHVVSALMSGVPLPAVQKQVGHKRLPTTEIYATVAPAMVKEAYEMRD